MEKYLGVKLVQAEVDNNELKGNGYKVIYEDGYESWSPKDVFEKAYRKVKNEIWVVEENLTDFQLRVVKECEDLSDKWQKLEKFIEENSVFKTLVVEEQNRLTQQLLAMKYYFSILVERIDNFKPNNT